MMRNKAELHSKLACVRNLYLIDVIIVVRVNRSVRGKVCWEVAPWTTGFIQIKNRIQDFAKIGRSRASSGIGFELIKNRLENFPLFINEISRVPDRRLSLFRSHIGIRNRSTHSYYSTRNLVFLKINKLVFRQPLRCSRHQESAVARSRISEQSVTVTRSPSVSTLG